MKDENFNEWKTKVFSQFQLKLSEEEKEKYKQKTSILNTQIDDMTKRLTNKERELITERELNVQRNTEIAKERDS